MAIIAISFPVIADQSITYISLDDAISSAPPKSTYEWKMSLQGASWEEGNSKSIGFSTKLQTKVNFILSPMFSVNIEGGLNFHNDNSQFAISEFGQENGFYANEAAINLNLSKNIIFSAGALDQGILNAPLLISSRSFPGLRQELSIKKTRYELGLIAQELIPTATLFNDERDDNEEVPTFYTGTIFAGYNFAHPFSTLPTARLNARVALSYFQFNDLPADAAHRGILYGHIGENVGLGPNSRFKYEFAGYLIEPSISLVDENNYELTWGGYWADNTEAKQNDRIQSVYISAEKVIQNYKLGLKVENFFKDSEVSPAVYSSSSYGGNNRKGNVYEASLEFSKYNFKVVGQYYDLNLISKNSIQDDRQAYYLGVETLYVKF